MLFLKSIHLKLHHGPCFCSLLMFADTKCNECSGCVAIVSNTVSVELARMVSYTILRRWTPSA
jgi:hypothetical protein